MGVGGWGWVGWVESIIRLISAEAEAEALLGLAELGNMLKPYSCAWIYFSVLENVGGYIFPW